MKQFFAFVRKEVYHILRDYRTMLVLVGMPIVQIILFGFALSNEVKNTTIGVFDQSNNESSKRVIEKFQASAYFDIVELVKDPHSIDQSLRSGKTQIVMVIPSSFASGLSSNEIQFITDGSNPNLATTLLNYGSAILQDYQLDQLNIEHIPYTINVTTRMLYNPQLKGEYTFVPGVIALLLMLICTMMTAVSIVREKEMGNMEILLVSPMHPLAVLFSKAAPYILMSLIILTIILGLSVGLLNVPIKGSILLLYGVSLIFIIASLALGLLISTITSTQQAAMMVSLIGLMLPTMMFSGFMFPIESMPLVLQYFSNIVPAKWYFYSLQAIMIKGLSFDFIIKEILILGIFAILFLSASFRSFKIRLT